MDKVAEYRAFARMRRAFPQSYTSYEMGNFSRFLIKVSAALCSTTSRLSALRCALAWACTALVCVTRGAVATQLDQTLCPITCKG